MIRIRLLAIIVLAVHLLTGYAYASAEEGAPAAPSGRGHFHWLTHNCSADESGEVETTPGSPPMNVDDPATPGCNNWEINFTADGDISRDENNFELPLLDVNYGVGDNLQLKYEVPNLVLNTPEAHRTFVGPSKVGVKYQFYGNDDSRAQMAFYPQVQFSTPGSHNDATESHGTVITLPLLFAKRIANMKRGPVMMTANLGFSLASRQDSANSVGAAFGVGIPLAGKTSLLAEVATEQATARVAEDAREHVIKLDVGAMGPIGKHFSLFGSVGRSLVASDDKNHTYFVAGIRLLLGE